MQRRTLAGGNQVQSRERGERANERSAEVAKRRRAIGEGARGAMVGRKTRRAHGVARQKGPTAPVLSRGVADGIANHQIVLNASWLYET